MHKYTYRYISQTNLNTHQINKTHLSTKIFTNIFSHNFHSPHTPLSLLLIHAHTNTPKHTHTHAHTHASTHTHTHTRTHTHTLTHTYTHPHTHTHPYTHIHTHTHKQSENVPLKKYSNEIMSVLKCPSQICQSIKVVAPLK